ncbi:MAG: hypothetical protein ACXWP0_13640, partial [Ktedonobacterales bacterium]
MSKQEAEDILTTLARVRANATRRREAEQAKQEQERQAFLAGGGVCWTCRDKGIIPVSGEPCPECPHGQKVRMQRELRQVRAMLDASGMSERVREWTLASYPAQDNPKFAKVVDFLTQWDEHQSLMLVGPYGCVAGETVMQGPDGDERIDVLHKQGKPIRVWALGPDGIVPAWGTAPFIKGIAPLYRIVLDNGQSIIATAHHRFMTPDGWRVLG